MKLEVFLRELGSKKGTPGGGAAAALTGASGIALIEMVARLNDARKKSSSGTASRAAGLRSKMMALMALDGAAFERIQKLYRHRGAKKLAWQSALKNGAQVPMRMAELCATAAALVKKEKARTSRWLESDRKESILLLRAAFDAANLNVEINLKETADAAFCARARKRMRQWRLKLQRS